MTTEALEALGATTNFIDIWVKLLKDNYEIRSGIYIKAIKDMLKKYR